jgi:hypothetical protein
LIYVQGMSLFNLGLLLKGPVRLVFEPEVIGDAGPVLEETEVKKYIGESGGGREALAEERICEGEPQGAHDQAQTEPGVDLSGRVVLQMNSIIPIFLI